MVALRLLVVALALHAVAAQSEGLEREAEKHQIAEIDDVMDEASAVDKERELMWGNFKSLVDSYMAENKRLVEENYAISRDIDDGRLGIRMSTPFKYSKVPNFSFLTAAKPLPEETIEEGCQVACNRQPVCKSYSWNKRTNKCYISAATPAYTPDAVMYLKKVEGESAPGDDYQEIPGLLGDASESSATQMSFLECRHGCTSAGPLCKAFAYFAKTQSCASVGSDVQFSPDWKYAEKLPQEVDHGLIKEVNKENAFKKKLQFVWRRQAKEEAQREEVARKEVKEKCAVEKKTVRTLLAKKEIVQKGHDKDVVRLNQLEVERKKQRDMIQQYQEGYLRFKTRALKYEVQKELTQKASRKTTDVAKAQKLFIRLDTIQGQLEDATAKRNHFQQETRKPRLMDESLGRQMSSLNKDLDSQKQEIKLWEAKYYVGEASRLELCEADTQEDLSGKLQQATEVAAQKRFVAVEAQKKAKELVSTSERANKLLVKQTEPKARMSARHSAVLAGDAADIAQAEAEAAIKAELAAKVAKDKLQMQVSKAAADAQTYKEKLKESKEFLAALQKGKAAATTDLEKEQEASQQ